ncbi:hypothetical protein LEP1GSC083_0987 [Leptospira interrogans serovar Pyrogenes str. L0374]|uniref:Uncharacterized protein n=1 Tax=Leptospira interrogans serovar Pyrogenes str. L0374 TaxID=1049928 RepID=M6KI72_LEPIR|nr:hypothetical protein LEP1GSC083_0987 [Leptospira interrogans serovar Pyrogenes str. L0374]
MIFKLIPMKRESLACFEFRKRREIRKQLDECSLCHDLYSASGIKL